MDQSQILTPEERRELDHKSQTALCECGHEKSSHSRFINGLFRGCQLCNCQEFKWPTIQENLR